MVEVDPSRPGRELDIIMHRMIFMSTMDHVRNLSFVVLMCKTS